MIVQSSFESKRKKFNSHSHFACIKMLGLKNLPTVAAISHFYMHLIDVHCKSKMCEERKKPGPRFCKADEGPGYY